MLGKRLRAVTCQFLGLGDWGSRVQISALRPSALCKLTQNFLTRRAGHCPFAKRLQICPVAVRASQQSRVMVLP
jgi:hypothetical protein